VSHAMGRADDHHEFADSLYRDGTEGGPLSGVRRASTLQPGPSGSDLKQTYWVRRLFRLFTSCLGALFCQAIATALWIVVSSAAASRTFVLPRCPQPPDTGTKTLGTASTHNACCFRVSLTVAQVPSGHPMVAKTVPSTQVRSLNGTWHGHRDAAKIVGVHATVTKFRRH
jgi:hypothetical protein